MERRNLLRGALASALLPAWASGAFAGTRAAGRPGQTEDEQSDPALALVRAYEAAQDMGRPLLVLLVPEDEKLRRRHGEAWGQLLTQESIHTLADLALCDLVCAEERLVRAALGSRIELAEPGGTALLIETGQARTVRIEVEIEEVPHYEKKILAAVVERLDRLSQAVRAPLAGSPVILERRLTECALSLWLTSDQLLDGGFVQLEGTLPAKIDRAPALARALAERASTSERKRWIELLAESTRSRTKSAPPGSRWGRYTGCGEEIDEPPKPLKEGEVRTFVHRMCGMGHANKLARHFLHFLSR
jgi:hypothetical protein